MYSTTEIKIKSHTENKIEIMDINVTKTNIIVIF